MRELIQTVLSGPWLLLVHAIAVAVVCLICHRLQRPAAASTSPSAPPRHDRTPRPAAPATLPDNAVRDVVVTDGELFWPAPLSSKSPTLMNEIEQRRLEMVSRYMLRPLTHTYDITTNYDMTTQNEYMNGLYTRAMTEAMLTDELGTYGNHSTSTRPDYINQLFMAGDRYRTPDHLDSLALLYAESKLCEVTPSDPAFGVVARKVLARADISQHTTGRLRVFVKAWSNCVHVFSDRRYLGELSLDELASRSRDLKENDMSLVIKPRLDVKDRALVAFDLAQTTNPVPIPRNALVPCWCSSFRTIQRAACPICYGRCWTIDPYVCFSHPNDGVRSRDVPGSSFELRKDADDSHRLYVIERVKPKCPWCWSPATWVADGIKFGCGSTLSAMTMALSTCPSCPAAAINDVRTVLAENGVDLCTGLWTDWRVEMYLDDVRLRTATTVNARLTADLSVCRWA